MTIDGYFDVVFGSSGDLTAVPDATQPDGTISYTQGWPVGYELPIGNPGRLEIERGSMNQLFYDVTSAIQQYQQTGTPPFITSTMNGGSPYSYSKYDRVIKSGVVYQSLVDANTDTPPTSNWAIPTILSSSGTSILKGNGSGGISNASAGTDYLTPGGNGSALTGITQSQISGLQPIRAWVNFDGTAGSPTAAASFGVTSITKIGAGSYTVNLSSAMPSVSFVVMPGGQRNSSPTLDSTIVAWPKSTTEISILTGDSSGNLGDWKIINIAAVGG